MKFIQNAVWDHQYWEQQIKSNKYKTKVLIFLGLHSTEK